MAQVWGACLSSECTPLFRNSPNCFLGNLSSGALGEDASEGGVRALFKYGWMRTKNKAFENRTPVEVVRELGFMGLLMVRSYLDRARGV